MKQHSRQIKRIAVILLAACLVAAVPASAKYVDQGSVVWSTTLDSMTESELEDMIAAAGGCECDPEALEAGIKSWVGSQGYVTSSSLSTALGNYYTKAEIDGKNFLTASSLSGYATETWVSNNFSLNTHTHDDRYYLKSEVDSMYALTVRNRQGSVQRFDDLNDYTTPGVWQWERTNYEGDNNPNAPIQYGYGTFKVEVGQSFATQTLTLQSDGSIWSRSCYTPAGAGGWTPWVRVQTSSTMTMPNYASGTNLSADISYDTDYTAPYTGFYEVGIWPTTASQHGATITVDGAVAEAGHNSSGWHGLRATIMVQAGSKIRVFWNETGNGVTTCTLFCNYYPPKIVAF